MIPLRCEGLDWSMCAEREPRSYGYSLDCSTSGLCTCADGECYCDEIARLAEWLPRPTGSVYQGRGVCRPGRRGAAVYDHGSARLAIDGVTVLTPVVNSAE